MKRPSNALLLLAADGFSAFGTWIDFLAILTLSAYQFHVDPYQMAIVSIAGLLPGILLSKVTGRLCDRMSAKRVLTISIAFRVCTTVGILLSQSFIVFLVWTAVRSIFTSAIPPAINTLAVRTLSQEKIKTFYPILNTINSAAKILAPAAGSIASSVSNEANSLVISVAMSAVALLLFTFVTTDKNLIPETSLKSDTGTTITAIESANIPLQPFLEVVGLYFLVVFMANNQLPLVLQISGLDKSLLGILVSCSGLGNIISGLWMTKVYSGRPLLGNLVELLIPAAATAVGFMFIGIGVSLGPPNANLILPALFLIIGVFSARFSVAANIYIATNHARNIGVASSSMQAAQNSAILIAPFIGAYFLSEHGASQVFYSAAAVGVVGFILIGVLRFRSKTFKAAA